VVGKDIQGDSGQHVVHVPMPIRWPHATTCSHIATTDAHMGTLVRVGSIIAIGPLQPPPLVPLRNSG
jgi:hypothetical protein